MSLEKIINDAWEIKDKITPETDKNLNHAIKEMIDKQMTTLKASLRALEFKL